jgi:hypothetical protein
MLRPRFVYFQVTKGQVKASVDPHLESAIELTKALDHPRTLMGDFAGVEAAFKGLLGTLGLRTWYARKPVTLVHLLEPADGGYTQLELRAFREAALGAGCSEVFLLDSREPPLTPTKLAEVRAGLTKLRWLPF